jgi:AcrR family transcriptional regulator
MPRRAGSTRSALLDSALDAFAAKGYAGASIREITRAVGVRESAFYAHFPSKRAVYEELFAEAGPPVAARALDALSNLAPRAFLPRFAGSIIEAWSAPRARKFAAMLMRSAFDSEGQGWKAMRASIDGALSLLSSRFADWQASGAIRTDVPAQTLAFEFVTTIAMTRFLFFNITAGRAEAARGHAVLKQHVDTFIALIDARSRKARK